MSQYDVTPVWWTCCVRLPKEIPLRQFRVSGCAVPTAQMADKNLTRPEDLRLLVPEATLHSWRPSDSSLAIPMLFTARSQVSHVQLISNRHDAAPISIVPLIKQTTTYSHIRRVSVLFGSFSPVSSYSSYIATHSLIF